MKPEVDQILGMSAVKLMTEIAPLLPPGYSQSMTGLVGIMLGFCAQEYERGADIRARENAAIRKLFAELAPDIGESGLRTRLLAAASAQDTSLTISALNTANGALKTLLIALQSYCETRNDKSAQAKIWAVLKDCTERRLLKLG